MAFGKDLPRGLAVHDISSTEQVMRESRRGEENENENENIQLEAAVFL